MNNLRDKRRARSTDELVGERGAEGRQAVRWEELEAHPFIQRLWQEVQVAKTTGGSADLTAVEADIAALESDVATAQADITAAQADATAAGSDATQALSDAAAAQSVADAGAADWVTLKAEYQAVTVEVDGSGYISGWRATSWADLDGTGGSVLELLGDVIVPGTLATNKLAVGIQGNSFINSDFMAPLAPNWVTNSTSGGAGSATTLSINPAGDPYAWNSFPTISAYQNDGSTTGYYKFACYPLEDIAGTLAPGWAVTPGERVSFSARVSAHRCEGSLEIHWFTGTGIFISVTDTAADPEWVAGNGETTSAGPTGSDTNPDLWDQLWILADAPSNAGYYLPVFRKGPSGSGDANSEMFAARPMHCRTHANASSWTPYSPEGTTLIDGDRIITGSITADKITVASLSALGITVGSADIDNAAIGSAQLAGTIQSDNFVAGTSGWRIKKDGTAEFQQVTIRAIQTADIAAAAITEIERDTFSFLTVAGSVSSPVTIATLTISEASALLTVSATVELETGDGARWWIEKDSAAIHQESSDDRLLNSGQTINTFSTALVGSGTYRIRGYRTTGSFTQLTGQLNVQWNKR
jgi:hypothetical protein